MDARQHFNIMTSSDDALILPLAVSLTAIGKNLPQDRIDFYLLHSDMCPQSMDLLSAVCAGYGNIFFHEIRVENPEAFDPLLRRADGRGRPIFRLTRITCCRIRRIVCCIWMRETFWSWAISPPIITVILRTNF